MAQKLGLKKKYRSLDEVGEETANEISNLARDVVSKTLEIGRIVYEKKQEIDPKYADYFNAVISEWLHKKHGVELKPNTIAQYETYFKKIHYDYEIKDFSKHVEKSGLGTSFYIKSVNRSLPKEKFFKIEREAIKFKRKHPKKSVLKILEQHLPKKPEFIKAEALEAYDELVNGIEDSTEGMERLIKSRAKGVLSQGQINALADRIWTFTRVSLPRFVLWLEKHNAKINPQLKKLVEKLRR